jgi:hypothetical protein
MTAIATYSFTFDMAFMFDTTAFVFGASRGNNQLKELALSGVLLRPIGVIAALLGVVVAVDHDVFKIRYTAVATSVSTYTRQLR